MKILIADKFPKHNIEKLISAGHQVTFNPDLKKDDLPGAIGDNEVLVVRSTEVRKPTLDAAKNLKLVIRAGSGYNTIDFKEAGQMGIAVCNTPGMNSIAVAELVFAHMLAIDRRIVENVNDLRKGVWNKKEYSKADGIYGKTLAVVGVGAIGGEVIKRAKAFGLKVNALDIVLTPEKAKEMGVGYFKDIKELIKTADIITLHLPYIKGETHHIINKEVFEAMKPRAIFIDCTRGGIVDQEALKWAMTEKGIRVGRDVYDNEPEATDKEFKGDLASYSNFYGTHHIGASTEQAQDAVSELALKIIEEYAQSGKAMFKVN